MVGKDGRGWGVGARGWGLARGSTRSIHLSSPLTTSDQTMISRCRLCAQARVVGIFPAIWQGRKTKGCNARRVAPRAIWIARVAARVAISGDVFYSECLSVYWGSVSVYRIQYLDTGRASTLQCIMRTSRALDAR